MRGEVKQQSSQRLGVLPISICALFLLTGAVLSGQDDRSLSRDSSSGSEASAARFSVHSDLVLVPVTVTTRNGRVVPGLAKEDFTLLQDNVPQVITHFTSEDAPATIGLVFDCSDSMAGSRLSRAREAAFALLSHAGPEDEFFLIRFSDHAELTMQSTRQTGEVRRAVEKLRVGGFTAVVDAVKMALLEMNKANHRRKAIVLFSDGEDNHSRTTTAEFKQLATESDTTIYTLFISDAWGGTSLAPGASAGAGLLNDIARQTGGHMFTVSEVKQLPKIAAKIGSWIRSQYVLGYVPPDEERSGRYHHIQVKIAKPAGLPKLHSSWRLGYYAPTQ
jgi:Ca-activated chloride channel family protein